MKERHQARSESPYEDQIGFSRAVRMGDRVVVAGTAPIWPDGSCDPDPEKQARRAFEIAVTALREVGADTDDVVRTRMYLTDRADAEAIGRAHKAFFGDCRPAATMVVVGGLIDDRWKVEVELDAEMA